MEDHQMNTAHSDRSIQDINTVSSLQQNEAFYNNE